MQRKQEKILSVKKSSFLSRRNKRQKYASMCECVHPGPDKGPSRSPLAGRGCVRRSNEGVISLAGRLLRHQLMGSQPSALTGSAARSFPPPPERTAGDIFPLSARRLGEWPDPAGFEVRLLRSVCMARCRSAALSASMDGCAPQSTSVSPFASQSMFLSLSLCPSVFLSLFLLPSIKRPVIKRQLIYFYIQWGPTDILV